MRVVSKRELIPPVAYDAEAGAVMEERYAERIVDAAEDAAALSVAVFEKWVLPNVMGTAQTNGDDEM
jgi:hypothetical protein